MIKIEHYHDGTVQVKGCNGLGHKVFMSDDEYNELVAAVMNDVNFKLVVDRIPGVTVNVDLAV